MLMVMPKTLKVVLYCDITLCYNYGSIVVSLYLHQTISYYCVLINELQLSMLVELTKLTLLLSCVRGLVTLNVLG